MSLLIEDGIHRIDGFDEAVLNQEPFDYDLAAWNSEKYVGPVNRHPMKNRKQPRRC